MFAIAQIHGRGGLRPGGRRAHDTLGIDNRDLHQNVAGHRRRVQDRVVIRRRLSRLDVAAQVKQHVVEFVDRAQHVFLEHHREAFAGARGVLEIEQPLERGAGAGGDHFRLQAEILRPAMPHHRRQVEALDDRLQEAAPLGHALDQVDARAIAALQQDRQDKTRKAGARAEVGPTHRLALEPQQLGAVEEMAAPELREGGRAHEIGLPVGRVEHAAEGLGVGCTRLVPVQRLPEAGRKRLALRRRGDGHGPAGR